jgi:hypothetical protein
MANTNILIKRSETVGVPGSLLAGELAYSYSSNTIFIGSPTGNGVVNVGGQFYTAQVDNATDAATGSTLVKRDATGNASFNYVFANVVGEIEGNANSATQLQTARNFSIDGTDITAASVSFNGTGDVVLNASLDAVPGLSAGSYGSTTSIPVITVGANGRVLAISTDTISTQFEVEGDTGTTTIEGGETFYMIGGDGITSAVTANTATFNVDNTVIRTLASVGPQTIDTDLTITGNVNITGNVISHGSDDLIINDPIILLANNNTADVVDIGFIGHYVESGNTLHTGLIRHAATDSYYLFKDYLPHIIDQNNILNIADPTMVVSALYANLVSKSSEIDKISSSTGIVTVDDNLTVNGDLIVSDDIQSDTVQANTIYVANRIFGDTTNNTLLLAPSVNYGPGVNDQYIILDPTTPNHIHVRAGGTIDASSAELYLGGEQTNVQVSDGAKEVYIRANNAHVWTFEHDGVLNLPGTITSSTGIVTVDDNLTVTGNLVVTGDIVIDDLQVDTITANTLTLTNALTVPNGGTGVTSFTSGQIVIGSGINGLTQIANSAVAVGQTFGSASSVAAFETDVYGRVVAVSNTSIAIDAAAITSGTLPIARGGTNGTSFTDNQITYFDGTKIASLANTTYTQTGTLTSNNTITSITVDGYGRFTAATVGAISGLTVDQGGTGLSTITQNGITYGNGTGAVGVTASAGTADQTWSNQILTVTNAGVPVWTTALDGGQF